MVFSCAGAIETTQMNATKIAKKRFGTKLTSSNNGYDPILFE